MKLDRQKYLESRSVKPREILLGLVFINLLLGAIVFLFPDKGLMISNNLGLKFPSRTEIFSLEAKQEVVVDVDSILQDLQPVEEIDSAPSLDVDLLARINQTLENTFTYDSIQKKWKVASSVSLENPQALKTFFEALMYESDTTVVRVLHYGDSQLEGDRITDYLRNRLQNLFGGNGPGFVMPLEPTAGARRTAYVKHSPNFKKHAVYKKGSSPPNDYYGLGGASFEIQGFYDRVIGYDTLFEERKVLVDSLTNDSAWVIDTITEPLFEKVNQNTAFLQVYNSKSSYQKVRSYERVRLLYSADEPFGITLRADSAEFTEKLPATKYGLMEWNRNVTKSLRINVLQGKFPLIYGLALDGNKGVAVDNFPMRGSSDIGFTRADSSVYGFQLKVMNVKMVVLQYGVNVIPYVVSDYSYYKRRLIKEIQRVKDLMPGVSVLVIGPSDMSRNKGGAFVSYPNIPLVKEAMREAALQTDCAFWDLYQAMGGENAMVAWVDKGYASKDYTHFSSKGAKYVGEMLFEVLLEQLLAQGYIN